MRSLTDGSLTGVSGQLERRVSQSRPRKLEAACVGGMVVLEMDRKLLAMDRDKMRNEFTGILFLFRPGNDCGSSCRILSSSSLFRRKSERLLT